MSIQDNAGNNNSFFFEVFSLTHAHDKVDSLYLKLSGDTTIIFNHSKSGTNWFSYWDEFTNIFDFTSFNLISPNNSNILNQRIFIRAGTKNSVNSNGSDKIDNLGLLLFFPSQANFSSFEPIDTNQTITYRVIEKKRVQLSFNITVKDARNYVPNNYTLEGYIEVSSRD